MPSLFDSYLPAGVPLSQFTATITNAVASARELINVWVIAELSDVRVASGHCYMELIEKNEAGTTVAKLRANIWRNSFMQLRQKFYNITQRDISNGIKVLIRGSVIHHSVYGLSFNIVDIDPSYTSGDLERLRREIILRLQKEGILMGNKSLQFPLAPQKIAVISAEGAAGYGDFINHLNSNSEGFVFYPCLFPCAMQGEKVSESIRGALRKIEATRTLWDCVVIVRGGGATTDLNGFDDYELAKAVATFPLPIVVGIGHERDRNVLDEIANISVKTPTAVAGFFIDRLRNAYDYVLTLTERLRNFSTELMRGEERRLSSVQVFIPQLALRKIEEAKSNINTLQDKIPLLLINRLNKENVKIESIQNYLSTLSKGKLEKENIKIDGIISLLKNFSAIRINQAQLKTKSFEELVNVLNPMNTLKRGYSITRVKGKSLKSIKEVTPDDEIITVLQDGQISSKILK